MKCPSCGADSDNRFCPYCGSEMPRREMNDGSVEKNTTLTKVVNDSYNHVTNIYYVSGSEAEAPSQFYSSELCPRVSSKDQTLALILCILLGEFGAHYFYVGRIGKGFLYLLTGGLLGIGWIVDIIKIALGKFHDQYGLRLCSPEKGKAQTSRPVQGSGKAGRFFQGLFRVIFALLFIFFALMFFVGFQSEGMSDPVGACLFLAVVFLIFWIILVGRRK